MAVSPTTGVALVLQSLILLSEFAVGIPRDVVGITNSVLKAPPLAVRRDEIER